MTHQEACLEVARLTHINAHTDARLFLAERAKNTYLINIYNGIKMIENAERCIPHEVSLYRLRIDLTLQAALIFSFGEKEGKELFGNW